MKLTFEEFLRDILVRNPNISLADAITAYERCDGCISLDESLERLRRLLGRY